LGVVRWHRQPQLLLLEAEEHLVAEGDGLLELLPPLEQRGALDVVLLRHLDRAPDPHAQPLQLLQLVADGRLPAEAVDELGHRLVRDRTGYGIGQHFFCHGAYSSSRDEGAPLDVPPPGYIELLHERSD